MHDAYPLIGLLAWLQFKHFIADYVLQPAWILRGKGKLLHPGGYAHAGLHALGSLPALAIVGQDGPGLTTLVAAEFVVHFVVDHFKAIHARTRPAAMTSRAYWAAHGADQLLHHLTYAGMLVLVVSS